MVMASMYAPTAPKLSFPNHKKQSSIPFTLRRPSLIPFPSSNSHSLCRCLNASASDDANSTSGVGGNNVRWDSMVQDFVRNAIKQFDSLISSLLNDDAAMAAVEGGGEKEKEWDWDRWRQYFEEVDEQERLLTILKARLRDAVYLEDYEDAARLKVAIAAASTNDSVGRVMSYLNSAIKEERYTDAAFLRDEAGAGLVGWWAGSSKDFNDPHGLIIRITPEHGRYVARSYSPRQLATSGAGVPLFEFFLTMDRKGEFKSQAVYLKRRGGAFHGPPTTSPKALSASERLGSVESTDDRSELFVVSTEDPADDRNDGSDPAEGMPGFQNVMKDMIPGVKVKIFKVTHPEKVDKDIISKVIEQIIEEEEDEDNDEDDEEEEEEEEEEDDDEDEDEGEGDEEDEEEGKHNDEDSDDTPSSDSEEKPEFVFVELLEIRKDVQCPICLGIIKKTRTVMECLHRFCRECIDKSMRLGNNECPACRTHCASRRSLRDDPKYDALIAALYPDIEKYEEEELEFREEEKNRNKQIQASIAKVVQRQSEALVKRRKDSPSVFVTRSQRNQRNASRRQNQVIDIQGSEDNEEENDNNEKDSSSADERGTEARQRRRKRWTRVRTSQPSSSMASPDGGCAESDLDNGRENRGLSRQVSKPRKLTWGRGGFRSHTRHGSGSGISSKSSRSSRVSKMVDFLRNLDENADELDIHLMLYSLGKRGAPSLEKPHLCCRPTLSVKNLCEYVARQTPVPVEEVEILAVKGCSGTDFDKSTDETSSLICDELTTLVIDPSKYELEILQGDESLAGIRSKCISKREHLILAYRRKGAL